MDDAPVGETGHRQASQFLQGLGERERGVEDLAGLGQDGEGVLVTLAVRDVRADADDLDRAARAIHGDRPPGADPSHLAVGALDAVGHLVGRALVERALDGPQDLLAVLLHDVLLECLP
jgi:hypothetical protein